jgi:uncharacterized membrane protein YdjX (TVP38/TMEM64 family)
MSTPKHISLSRLWPLALLVVALALFYAFGLNRIFKWETIIEQRGQLQLFVESHNVEALLLYIAGYMAVTALSLPGGTVMTLMGGWLFGGILGGASAVAAATSGAIIVFIAAKTAFGDILVRKGGKRLAELGTGFQKDAASYLLFLRLVPLFPFWLVNLAPALFGVSLKTFAVTTLIGIIPGAFAFAFAGAGLSGILDMQEAQLKACRSAGHFNCSAAFEPKLLATPELLIGLAILGFTALIPIALKRFYPQFWASLVSRS